jgi:hypothetical protein
VTPELELGKWALQWGGPMAGLLALLFFFYRKDMMKNSEDWRGQSGTLLQVVKENTAAITRNTEVVQSLHQHMFSGERRNNP